jgi:hypothetical protein
MKLLKLVKAYFNWTHEAEKITYETHSLNSL